MLPFNLKIAFRNIWKNRVFSSINIIGLALSLACCMVIGLYIWNELSFDRFHHNFQNIVRLTEKQDQAGTEYAVAVTPGPLAPALERNFPQVKNTVRFGHWSGLLKTGSTVSEEKNIQLTDNSIFKVFDFPLVLGNALTALNAPDEIVITEHIANKYLGKEWRNNNELLGQVFQLNNQDNFKLVGIAKDVPGHSSIQFDILLPITYLFKSDEWSNKWNSNNYHTYVQLSPGTDYKDFEKQISKQLGKYNPDTKDLLTVQPLSQQYLYSAFDFKTDWGKRNSIKYIRIFSSVGLLLLAITCFNFINLSTARSLKRAMEVGIRKVNGARRRQLIFQFLIESVMMAGFGGLVALVIINLAQPWLAGITGTAINTSLSNLKLYPLFAGFILVVGLIAGLYPAFVLSSFRPSRILKNTGPGKAGSFFRKTLVITQFTVAISLIICTTFMYRQLQFIQQKDLGFDKEQIVRIRLGNVLREKSMLYSKELQKLAGVKAAAPATMSLADVDNSSYLEWDGMQPTDKFLITQANVDPGFIPALQLKLLSGDNFSASIGSDTATYILNESTVKKLGYNNLTVLNKQVSFWGTKGRIIGVVKDFHFKPLNTGIAPFILRYQPKEPYFNMFVKLYPGNTTATLQQLQKIYASLEPDTPFEFSFLDDSINRLYEQEKRTTTVIFLFSAFTIFIAYLGLFGLAIFAAEQRVKEIGIRKVLGAGVISITGLLTRDFLKLVLVGMVLACPIAWFAVKKWLQQYAYRIDVEWTVFILCGILVTFLALFTIGWQAVRSATANPIKSLRTE